MNSLAIASILAQDDAGGGGGILSLLIILVPLGAIFYLAVVPQRKARQRQAEMLRTLDVGDEIVTNGGILGVITHIEDEVYHLEVDNDVVIRIAKSAVASSTTASVPADKPASRSRKGLLGGALGGAAGKDDDEKPDASR